MESLVDTVAPTREEVSSRLSRVDWSFASARPSPTDKLHPYPAKFIGELPRALISALGLPKGARVLDPFCGSGTTLAEAQKVGIHSVGVDLNPIACLIARVRIGPRPVGVREACDAIVATADATLERTERSIPNVDHWFSPEVKQAVADLADAIATIEDNSLHRLLSLALSSILVRVSRQDSDTRYAAVDKDVSRAEVLQQFRAAGLRIDAALEGRPESLAEIKVVEGNTLTLSPEALGQPFDAVITSPPYPNAYEYWLYHKYRMWWLGYDPLMVRKLEIGARPKYFSSNPATAESFAAEMSVALGLCLGVLRRGGHICVVIGRSRIRGIDVDNARIMENVLLERGCVPVFRTERTIASGRKSFNLSHAAIKSESVIVYQKR